MRFVTLTILLFCSLNTYSIYFKQIGVKDGLSQLSVHSIYQDKLGRMWFGTLEGVSIFNGEEIINYKDNSHLQGLDIRDNSVKNIVGLPNGDVFYRLGACLIRYVLDEDTFHYLRDGVSVINHIDDRIFLAVNDTIYLWDEAAEALVYYRKTGLKAPITAIHIDSNDYLWVGTNHGLYKALPERDFECIIPTKDISVLFESSSGHLWVGTRIEGLYRISPNDNPKAYLHNPADASTLSHSHIRTITEDRSGNIWIGTFLGLNKYDSVTETFTVYKKDNIRGSLSHSSIFSLLVDKQGVLWVGTYYGGVNYFNSMRTPFVYYSADPKRAECLNFPFISDMVEDRDGDLWICAEGGGLSHLNRRTNLFTHYEAAPTGNTIRHNNLKGIAYDKQTHKLYIATYTGGLSCLDISSRRFTNYLDIWPDWATRHRNISCVNVHRGNIIFLDDHGLFRIDSHSGLPIPLFAGSDDKRFFGSTFIIDAKENLWMANGEGILRIPLQHPEEQKTFYSGQKGLGGARLSAILETAGGDIFFSTEGTGIFRYVPDTDTFSAYTATAKQLLSDFCYALTEAPSGRLVISCDKGLSFLDPSTGTLIYSATIERDLPFSALNSGCRIYTSPRGEIFVGSADGLLVFFEEVITAVNDEYDLYYSDLFINHQRIVPSGDSDILRKILARTKELKLNYKQNNFIFVFANSNYLRSSASSQYEYKLEGFDRDWIPTHNTRLSYTNLHPGRYTLRVREVNSRSIHPHEISMDVVIRSPFYNTPPAWAIYIGLFASLLYFFLAFRQRQIRLRASLEYERKEKNYITELNKAKISFFTNISHEFRTPLSLIITQVEMLLQNKAVSAVIREKIQKLYRSTFQMRTLVNELLDFQKLGQKQAHLMVSCSDLVSFVYAIVSLFDEKAGMNGIRYTFHSLQSSIDCWFDPGQLRKVIFNLLSNAFKYTSRGGLIEVVLGIRDDRIELKIIDSGIGIDKKDLDNIFERYYQASNSISTSRQGFGTGLGLALSKDITELHGGNIQVESKLGYGSIFIVNLRCGKEHFENNPQVRFAETTTTSGIQEETLSDAGFIESLSATSGLPVPSNPEERQYKMLVVEDNDELLNILATLFSPFYQVLLAQDGEEGLLLALNKKPDIIVSDVMMPRMGGDEMCFELKKRINTCHIPIVLLTAQSSAEKNIEGLLKGADDYITKPFNTRILLTKCNTLLRNRLLLQQQYRCQPASTIQLLAANETDKKFLEKAGQIIERFLSEPEFSIDKLALEIAMSRRSLYTKFKQLTGMTPNDFILNYKLKRAAFMLTNHPAMQIVEISDALGFSSARYFSRCFKGQFDMSPMEYRKAVI